jgi:hypothetical protein
MNTADMLRVTDSRTGRSYELAITDGAIRRSICARSSGWNDRSVQLRQQYGTMLQRAL